jgi:hypothetical protein
VPDQCRLTLPEQRRAHADRLHRRALERIDEIGHEAAADILRMTPPGVAKLVARRDWTLDTAKRVADRLGVASAPPAPDDVEPVA